MRRLRGPDVIGTSYAFALLRGQPGDSLHLALAYWPSGSRMAREVHNGIRRGKREKGRHDCRAIDLGIELLDVMAQIVAELDRLGEHAQALQFNFGASRRRSGPRDPQLSGIRPDFKYLHIGVELDIKQSEIYILLLLKINLIYFSSLII